MRTGKLAIARGYQLAAPAEPAPSHLVLVPGSEAEPAAAPDPPSIGQVGDRLSALERLTRLYEQGALSADEFLDEKAAILGRRADAPVSFSPSRPPSARGPSLLGRVFDWKLLLISLVVGLGFSFVTQPDTTLRLFDQVGRYFGA